MRTVAAVLCLVAALGARAAAEECIVIDDFAKAKVGEYKEFSRRAGEVWKDAAR